MNELPADIESLYPFDPHRTEVAGGHRLHYVDEGDGEPVVMIHGNPTWSFYYRELIKRLRGDFRCLAVDHIGCGLSDKPDDDAYDYTLKSRVDDLDEWISAVVDDDQKLTLVMHDWGGMIGTCWAVRNPRRIDKLVVMNTAAFHNPHGHRLPAALWLVRNTPVGAFLVDRFNAFSRGAVRFAASEKMPEDVRRGYTAPYQKREDRIATLRFVQDIPLEPADPAYDLVSETEQNLSELVECPTLLAWGLEDFVFGESFLDRWKEEFPNADTAVYPEAGHLVLEDRTADLTERIEEFLHR